MRRTMGYIGHKQLKKFTKAIAKVWLNQKLYDPKDRLIFKRENFNNICPRSQYINVRFYVNWIFPLWIMARNIFYHLNLVQCQLFFVSSRIAILLDWSSCLTRSIRLMDDDYKLFKSFYSDFIFLSMIHPVIFSFFFINIVKKRTIYKLLDCIQEK